MTYTPTGELVWRDGESDTPFLYCGEYGVQTDGNGLLYMRARYYSPEIGRFLSEDSVVGSLSITGSLNRYAYCGGNPVSYVDPTGNIWQGFYHNIVVKHIAKSYNIESEERVTYNTEFRHKMKGRVDLVNIKNLNIEKGEVWEVKPKSWANGYNKLLGEAQLQNYVNNSTLDKYPSIRLMTGGDTIQSGEIYLPMIFSDKYIRYENVENGMIYYSIENDSSRQLDILAESAKEFATGISIGALISFGILFPETAPEVKGGIATAFIGTGISKCEK